MRKVTIYYVDIGNTNIDYDDVPFLVSSDYKKANKYKDELKRKQHLISCYFKRKYMKDYVIDQYGKPKSDMINANISHSYNMIVIALCDDCDVGIDVEKVRFSSDNLRKYISDDKEYEYIKDDRSFYEIWTSKESLAKAEGKGMTTKPNSIPALPLNGKKTYLSKSYYSHLCYIDDYVISITINSDEPFEYDIIKENIK